LDEKKIFSYTAYNFPALLQVCEKLARQSVLKAGGRIEKDANGKEVFVIPVKAPTPSKFENIREPGPIANSRFTDEEMARIRMPALQWALPKLLPGWQVSNCDMDRCFVSREWRGKNNVAILFASDESEGLCTLSRKLEITTGKKTTLQLAAGCPPNVKVCDLLVKVDGKERLRRALAEEGWLQVEVDLSDSAGKVILLEIAAQPKATGGKDRKKTAFCLSVPSIKCK
jgi:hypothetical protein